MSENQVDPDPKAVPRRDGLADERDDPQTQPATEHDLVAENAETSLDQPSGDVG